MFLLGLLLTSSLSFAAETGVWDNARASIDKASAGMTNYGNAVAAKYKSTASAISIAWLIARPSVIAPIASATSAVQLKEIIKGAKIKLEKADVDLLNKASEE